MHVHNVMCRPQSTAFLVFWAVLMYCKKLPSHNVLESVFFTSVTNILSSSALWSSLAMHVHMHCNDMSYNKNCITHSWHINSRLH